MDTPAHESSGEVYRQWGLALRTELYRLCKDSPYDFPDYSLLEDFPGASLDDLSIVTKASQYEKNGITVYLQCAAGEEIAYGAGKLSRNNINLVMPEYLDETGTPVLSRWLGLGIDEISGHIGYTIRDIQMSRQYGLQVDQWLFDEPLRVGKLAKLPEIEKIRELVGNEDPLGLPEYFETMAILEALLPEDAVKPNFAEEGL